MRLLPWRRETRSSADYSTVYYPLNGVAITEAKKRGSPYQLSLDPIWLPNSEDARFRVSIGGLADLARSLCASN